VQLRNIHISAGVSHLAGQEGVPEGNGQSTVKKELLGELSRCETAGFACKYAEHTRMYN